MYKNKIPIANLMNQISYFSFGRLSKFAKIFIPLIIVSSLFGCQLFEVAPTSITPHVEVQILTPSLLTETPVPACVVISDVELTVELLSENSVHIKITGLKPNEIVNAIFRSRTKDQEKEIILTGPADEKGVFEDSEGLRGQEVDLEFKEWEILVVHSRGSTCTEIILP